MIQTTIILACGHSYSHSGEPTKDEQRHPAEEVRAQCRSCRSPELIADVRLAGSR